MAPSWSNTNLGSVATWSSGGTPAKSRSDYWAGDVPWVSPKDMKRFSLDDAEDHISERAISDGARIVPAGTVFIVVRGMILAHTFPVCIAERAMSFNQDVKALVPRPGTDGRFLAHWLHGHADQLLRLVTEATHGTKRIELRDLVASPILLPELPEQAQVAEILDTLDEAIRRTDQLIAKLKQVKQGLLHDILMRGVDHNGEIRNSDAHPTKFKDSPLGAIPVEWRSGELADFLDGSPQNGLYKPANCYAEDGTPIIRIDSFRQGGVANVSQLKRVRLTTKERGLYGVESGDLVINRVNSIDYVGKAALVADALAEVIVFESNIMRVRVRRTDLLPAYVIHVLCSPAARRYFQRRAKPAIAQVSVNQEDVKRIPVPVPPLAEQAAIVWRVETLNEAIDSEAAELAKLRLLKSGLMEDLLTGRVRVTSTAQGGAA